MPRFREKIKKLVEAVQLQFPVQFESNGERIISGVGDWLVTEADGTQYILDAEEFEATFESIGPRGPRIGSGTAAAPVPVPETSGDAGVNQKPAKRPPAVAPA
jgi:hypothetical protein